MQEEFSIAAWLIDSKALYSVAKHYGIDTNLPYGKVKELVSRLPQPIKR
jgi:hypothetical protein